MSARNIQTKFERAMSRADKVLEKLLIELRDDFLNKNATIRTGKYAGRIGRIMDITFVGSEIFVLVPPYYLKTKDLGKLLTDYEALSMKRWVDVIPEYLSLPTRGAKEG